jgi:hypothetical protein
MKLRELNLGYTVTGHGAAAAHLSSDAIDAYNKGPISEGSGGPLHYLMVASDDRKTIAMVFGDSAADAEANHHTITNAVNNIQKVPPFLMTALAAVEKIKADESLSLEDVLALKLVRTYFAPTV